MTKANECTCPSGDGSLRHPCPAHPASVELAGVAANLTFINGRPAMCGCQVEYSSGGGEYSDVIYVTLCAKHSGSAILDLVATNRIALTPEYEGQWHADLYLDREIPLAKAEGATPAEAVLALMSAERIDPEQESVGQAGGDERVIGWRERILAAHPNSDPGFWPDALLVEHMAAEIADLRAALAQPSPVRSSLLINGYQLRAALEFIAPDGTAKQLESEARIEWRQQDADFLEAGLYAFCAEYPEEGGVLLDEEPTTAQPSPLQSEQAEAERPEMSPERAAYFMRRFKSEEKLLGPNEQAAVDYVLSLLAQHDRIVGALRADRDSWAEQAEQRLADWDEMRKERDAALARVAKLEHSQSFQRDIDYSVLSEYADKHRLHFNNLCAVVRSALIALPAQAQHSVPEGFRELLEMLVASDLRKIRYAGAWRREVHDRASSILALLAAAPAQGGE
ncbi:TPA: hypothetical protein L4U59_000474 [Pseudomonas aeruginosa]|nr:hypothetical protein [Pseudomonas aeruginosa]